MSANPRKNRIAFRPSLTGSRLEDRVVLNGSSAPGTSFLAQPVNIQPIAVVQAGQNNVTARQLFGTSRQQFRAAQISLRQFASNQLAALYNDPANLDSRGRLTPEALASFNANVAGAINATALRLSTQSSLLPGSGRRLVPALQNSLLGSQNNSLTSRITNLVNSGRFGRSQTALQNAINRQINASFTNNSARLTNFFRTTPLNRLSLDQTTGQRIPLSQFVNNQASFLINNTFGTLANSVGGNAQSALFNTNGVFNPQGVTGFQQQFSNALGTAAFQVGNVLSAFPNAMTTLGPQLQSSLFGTGNSFANTLSTLLTTGTSTTPLTVNGFNTGFQTAFTNAFQNFSTPLNNFFGITPTTGTGGSFQLPNGFFVPNATFPSVFGSQFTGGTFNNGFNNGFATTGTGFPGFGTAPTGFNTGFGTGFNSFVTNTNQLFGFTQPTFTTGTGFGTGTGTGTGTGLGTGSSFM